MSKLTTVYIDSMCFDLAGGQHYYATLKCYDLNLPSVDLTYYMNERQAKLLSRKDSFTYRAGDKTKRFFSEGAVITEAKSIWKDHYPKANLLVFGSPCLEPYNYVVGGSKKVADYINGIVKKFRALGEWDTGSNDKKEVYCKQWEKIMRRNK